MWIKSYDSFAQNLPVASQVKSQSLSVARMAPQALASVWPSEGSSSFTPPRWSSCFSSGRGCPSARTSPLALVPNFIHKTPLISSLTGFQPHNSESGRKKRAGSPTSLNTSPRLAFIGPDCTVGTSLNQSLLPRGWDAPIGEAQVTCPPGANGSTGWVEEDHSPEENWGPLTTREK